MDDTVRAQRQMMTQEYFRELQSERQRHSESRTHEREREMQERRQAATSSPWKWNHDHLNHLQHSATLPINPPSGSASPINDGHPHTRITAQLMMERRVDNRTARDYHSELDRMSQERQQRRTSEAADRFSTERDHLNHSLDVALMQSRQYKRPVPIKNPDFYDHKGHVPDVFERTALAHQQHPIPLKNPDFLDRTGHVPDVLLSKAKTT